MIDVFDAAGLRRAVEAARPEILIHQLTDLPYALEADGMEAALVRNARLRDEGTRNLVAAAVAAGAKRLIAQSIGFVYADGPKPHREEDALLPETHPVYGETVRAVASLERQVLGAPLDGIVLRYGLFYGPAPGSTRPSRRDPSTSMPPRRPPSSRSRERRPGSPTSRRTTERARARRLRAFLDGKPASERADEAGGSGAATPRVHRAGPPPRAVG